MMRRRKKQNKNGGGNVRGNYAHTTKYNAKKRKEKKMNQSKINVVIEGVSPILLHNPISMADKKTGKKRIPTPAEEAAAGCYWMPDKSSLMFPGENIHRAMVLASKAFKDGKRSASPYIAGCIAIAEKCVSFGTKEYAIDTRRVVIQKNGILRSRPMLENWRLVFTLIVDNDSIPRGVMGMLEEILKEVGNRIGIGDYRLEKGGRFGKFSVVKFEEE